MKIRLQRAAWIFFCMILCFSLLPGQARAEQPGVSAQSAVLMDQSSGRVLFEKNSHEKLPIASITKVMTAILAIESGKMDKTVIVSPKAATTEGSSVYLKPGEKIKLKDLVYGLMLRSGNDASIAIAEAVARSVTGFSLLMNEKARELGMVDTHFTNPSGLDHPNHYSTACDMAILTQYAMKSPVFRKIFKTRIYRAPATNKENVRLWHNKNKLLTGYEYSTGGKTGFTKASGRTLISTASKGDLDLIAVTINDRDDWKDHRQLFDWAFAEFQRVEVVRKGKIKARLGNLYEGHLFSKSSLFLPLTKDEQRSFTKKLILIKLPGNVENWTPPSPIGRLEIVLDGRTIHSVPLYYKQKSVEKKRGFWSIFHGILDAVLSGTERPLS
ncbi:D-alanyl-D-alanine carboxypeptidase [Sporolactobacillus sp. THM7-4]|nr:D-alanyl-D-alanine carboxypeptidase [Sporolactobacillus sp. THM7-4]